jgi:Na+-transporting methylmalonyl-CoA/oxaloacetate decarboxylase gamma subunit
MAEITVENQKLLDELVFEINDPISGLKITLKGSDAIKEYFTKEKVFWNEEIRKLTEKNRGSAPAHINSLLNFYNQMVQYIGRTVDAAKANNETLFKQEWDNTTKWYNQKVNHLSNYELLYSGTNVSNLILECFNRNYSEGYGAYRYISKQKLANSADPNELIGFMKAYDHYNNINRVQHELDSLTKLNNDWQQTNSSITSQFQSHQTLLNEWKDKFVQDYETWRGTFQGDVKKYTEEKEKQLVNLEDTYLKKLQLEAPVQLWKSRAKIYRKRGYMWLCGLAVMSMCTVILLVSILYNMPSAFHYNLLKGDVLAIKGLILFATILSVLVYLIRVFSKMTFSSFHIERDAEERERLSYIYLSLVKDGKIADDDRKIVLQSLFSRVDTGLLSGDSGPTMPSLFTKLG